jgi:hypothetical protein
VSSPRFGLDRTGLVETVGDPARRRWTGEGDDGDRDHEQGEAAEAPPRFRAAPLLGGVDRSRGGLTCSWLA